MKTVTEKALMDIVKELNGIRRGLDKKSKPIPSESKEPTINISDFIANMMLKGATKDEIERMTKYSMAVMDAKKEYNIEELYLKYGEEYGDCVVIFKEAE